ncbi:MAG: hypothetical protein HPY74_01415 [Firmicutes bacterium]|nr:hypothetical protein [Bacillota bacterium]
MFKNIKILAGNRGITLVELIIVVALVGLVVSISFPLINMVRGITSSQFNEAGQRTAVREASTYLANDIRYSKSVTIDPGNPSRMDIIDKDDNQVAYFLETGPGGENYLVRQKNGESDALDFKEIKGAQFVLETERLVFARLIIDVVNNKYYDFKIARLEYALHGGESEDNFYTFLVENTCFIYGSRIYFNGNEIISPDGTVILFSNLNTTDLNRGCHINVKNIYIDGNINLEGGSASLGLSDNTGNIYVNGNMVLGNGRRDIYGTVYVNGNLVLKDAIIHGTVYVNGNLTLQWTPTIYGSIQYTGTFTYPTNMGSHITSKCTKVDSVPGFDMPDYGMPPLKPDNWYFENGYVSGGPLTDGKKIFSSTNYTNTNWQDCENVIIVSKRDITLGGWRTVTGLLFAPNGKVTFTGARFEGIVIARDGFYVTSGGTTVVSRNIEEFIPNIEDLPFEVGE